MFGSPNWQWYRLAVSAETLAGLADRFPDGRATLITAQFADKSAAARIAADYASTVLEGDQAAIDAVAAGAAGLQVVDLDSMRQSRVFFAGILVAILMAFAISVGLVALVMVRFRIVADIEDSMADFGALKAMGYTSGQIAAGTLLAVGAVAGVGAGAGIAIGHAALPALAEALSAQSALTWRPGFDWAAGGICLGGIVGVALAAAGWTCRRLRRLTPLTALRSGLETRDFKRDRLPLRRLRLGLPWALAVKAGLRAPAQLATIALVAAPTAFMATIALGAYENMGGARQQDFWRTVGGELPDVVVEVADPAEAPLALAELEALGGVRKALEYSNALALTLNGDVTSGLATADFSQFEGALLYQGRFPAHPDEVAISARHAELLGLGVGGEVRLAAGGEDAAYLVTGLVQTMNGGGLLTAVTSAGLERIWPDRPWKVIGVYLDDPDGSADFGRRLEAGELIGPALLSALNLQELAQIQLGVYGVIMSAVAAVMLVVAAGVTTLVLVGVLGTAVRRQRAAFGAQRAIGFTTGQLLRQVAATYWPAAAAGVILGCAAGWALFPACMGALFRSLGIYAVGMSAGLPATAALAAGLALFALAVTLALAAQVRRATAYTLVNE
jgi:putative ABC transport system permease protein